MSEATLSTRLRVGLLIDSWIQPAWVAKIVEEIQSSSVAEVVLVIQNTAGSRRPLSPKEKISVYTRQFFYLLYSKIDHWRHPVEPDAFRKVDISPLLPHCAALSVKPFQKKYSDYFEEKYISSILSYRLDVALRFGFRILRGKTLEIAKYGVWSYHHGDNEAYRGGPAGFWEVMEGNPLTGTVLQILTEELDNGKVLYRSYAPTHPFSVRENRNNYYWKSSAFVLRKLQQLYEEGPKALTTSNGISADRPYSRRLYRTPTNVEMLRSWLGLCAKYFGTRFGDLFYFDQWFIAYHFEEHLDPITIPQTLSQFKPLFPPKDRFWADSFPWEKGGRYFIFIEEYLYRTRKGHIAVIGVDPVTGEAQAPVKVLEKDYHLAYPFVFEWSGEIYMIPESAANRTVELYRCVSFPGEWKLEKVLMQDLNAVDTSLVEIEGRWWMFVNIAGPGHTKNWDELYLFYADTPLGPWKPHRRNPVKSDVRMARPAGCIFKWKDTFYRPAQDCSQRYGYAVSLQQIIRIDLEEYAEEEVSKILPEWRKGLIGTHTLNRVGPLTVVDGLMRRGR